jgi:hypothetical protein
MLQAIQEKEEAIETEKKREQEENDRYLKFLKEKEALEQQIKVKEEKENHAKE